MQPAVRLGIIAKSFNTSRRDGSQTCQVQFCIKASRKDAQSESLQRQAGDPEAHMQSDLCDTSPKEKNLSLQHKHAESPRLQMGEGNPSFQLLDDKSKCEPSRDGHKAGIRGGDLPIDSKQGKSNASSNCIFQDCLALLGGARFETESGT